MDIINQIMILISIIMLGISIYYLVIWGIAFSRNNATKKELKYAGIFFASFVILFMSGQLLYYYTSSGGAHAEGVVTEFNDETVTLTDGQIKRIENEIIPQASEKFKFESVTLYTNDDLNYAMTFVITSESFGKVFADYIEPNQILAQPSDVTYEVQLGLIKAAHATEEIIMDKVDFEFKLAGAEETIIIYISDGEALYSIFEMKE